MKSSGKNVIVSFAPYILLCIYALCTVLTTIVESDDFVWHYIKSNDNLYKYRDPNGRYFSNIITTIITSQPVIKGIFTFVILAGTLYLFARLLDHEKKHSGLKMCYVLSLVILLPAPTYREAILWTSAFTNYVFPMMLTCLFLLFFFKVLFTDYNYKIYHLILFPVIGFCGGLCVEHITIYNILIGIVAVILLKVKKKKIYFAPVAYLISACVAALMMFNNNTYSQIAESGDTQAMRAFTFDFTDIFHSFIFDLMPRYSKTIWIINLIVAFSFALIYLNRPEVVKKSKYAPACMAITLVYAVYSILNATYGTFIIVNDAMRIRGVETALTFLYLVALAYLIWVFFEPEKKLRLYFYLLSTVLLTAPFIIVKPISARCYFAEYIFWILFSGEILFSVAHLFKLKSARFVPVLGICATAYVCVWMMGINITNKYYDNLRYNFFKQQIEEGKRTDIKIVEYPYEDYILDDLSREDYWELELGPDTTYFTLIFDYYGIDAYDIPFKEYTFISPLNYYYLTS